MLHSFEVCCCNYFINLMADSKDKSQLSLGHRFLKSVLGDNDNTTPVSTACACILYVGTIPEDFKSISIIVLPILLVQTIVSYYYYYYLF